METGDKIKDRSVVAAEHAISPAISSTDASVGKVDMGEVPLFTFEIIANATKHFSVTNLIGRGGFGHVYKVTNFLYIQFFAIFSIYSLLSFDRELSRMGKKSR